MLQGGAAVGLERAHCSCLTECLLPSVCSSSRAGKYELQVIVMCDAYVGCDRVLPVRLRVAALTRAAQEGRDARALAKQQQWASDDESEGGWRWLLRAQVPEKAHVHVSMCAHSQPIEPC